MKKIIFIAISICLLSFSLVAQETTLDGILEKYKGKEGISEIASLLDEGINAQDDNGGVTALIWASFSGHTDIVEALIKAEANLNIQDDNGFTTLIWASYQGHTEIVEALIKAGANLNIKDNDGDTALFSASYQGHTEIVEALIKAEANLNIKNNKGDTALIYASRQGHTDIIKLLEAGGAK